MKMKTVPGYPDYEVTDHGEVMSRKAGKIKILRPANHSCGYLSVGLCNKGERVKTYLIHRLVCEAFIPNPHTKPQVNHKDGNKKNNHVSNLEWCTNSENGAHSFMFLGRIPASKGRLGADSFRATPVTNLDTGSVYASIGIASNAINGSRGKLSECVNGHKEKYKGYRWAFYKEAI